MTIKYWVSGGTSWLLTSSWSLSQGGASGAAVPLPSDDVVFGVSADVSTAGGAVVSMTVNSGVTVNMSGTGTTSLSGDLTVNGTLNQTSASGAMIMGGATTSRIYMAAGVFHKLTINKSSGTATCRLDSAILVNVVSNTSVLTFTSGVFDFNSQTVTCSTFNSPSGTRTWNQTADMYVTGTGATQVFNVNAGLTTTSIAGTVRISGDAGATVIVIVGTSFTAASAWKISLENGYNYNCSGNIYDFNCNGVCSVTGAITVYNNITGAGLGSPLVTLNFSNSSGDQTRTFSWAGSWNIVNFTPGTGTGNIYNITYVRANTINCTTASQTYNFSDLAWTTGIVTCSGASSTYSFANLTWTTGTLVLSGTSSNFYFGTVVTTGLGLIQMTGTGSTYYMNNAGAVANIATVGDITFSNGTIEFGNIGNVILSCRSFTSGSGATRVINWSTTYNSYIQVNGTGGINISNVTGLTTNATDSMAGSTNNCGFKAVMTGGSSTLGALPLASGAFNMYVSGTHNIPSGTVRNLIILDNTTMTAAAAVSIYQTLIGVSLATQTLTGLVVTMLATDTRTVNFPYAIAGATFNGAGATWTITLNVKVATLNGNNASYTYVNLTNTGAGYTLTYGGSASTHIFTYMRGTVASFTGTAGCICTYTDFQLSNTSAALTIGGSGSTHNFNNVTTPTLTANALTTNYNYTNVTVTGTLTSNGSGTYVFTLLRAAVFNSTSTGGTHTYVDAQFTGAATIAGAGTTHNLTYFRAGATSSFTAGTSNFTYTDVGITGGVTLSGTTTVHDVYKLSVSTTVSLSGTSANCNYNWRAATGVIAGVLTFTSGILTLYANMPVFTFSSNNSNARTINFNDFNIITSGTGIFDTGTVTGLVVSRGTTDAGAVLLQGTGVSQFGAQTEPYSLRVIMDATCALNGTIRSLEMRSGAATSGSASAVTVIYGSVTNNGFGGGSLSSLTLTMSSPNVNTYNFPYTIPTISFTGAGATWTISNVIATTVVFNGSGSTYYVTGTSTITTLTHTNGTIDLTGHALDVVTSYTVPNNTNSKAINFGTNNINIASTTGTPWTSIDSNYLTCTGTGKVVVRGGTVNNGGTTRKYTDQPNFYLQENAAAYTLTSPFTCRDLTINNYTPTASFIFYIGGSLAWTFSGSGIPSTVTFTFNTTPAATISTNSTSFSIPTITVNEKTLSAASAVAFTTMTVNSGFNSAGYAITCGTILTVNSSGVITCGASTWTMLGSGVSTGWNAVAGSTMNAGTSNIIFSGSGEKYAAFGSAQTVNQLTTSGTFTPSTGGNGTNWLNLTTDTKVTTLSNTVNPSGFKFTATPTVTNMNNTGISGSLTYIQGNVNSSSTYLKDVPYLSLLNSVTTGGAGWYLGSTAVNNGVNTGWKFIKSTSSSGFSSF